MNQAFETHQKCLVCNSNSLSEMIGYEACYLTKCRECHFVFTKRVPTVSELIAHYETYGRNDYLSPITVKRYHEILDLLEPFRKTNKLIDVGCGIGHFLQVAAERGWDVYGTEFTDEAIAICESKGIQMQQGTLDPAKYDGGNFDVIISIEVLEHINNPIEEISKFHTILRPGGAVYLTTPNFNSVSRHYLKDNWSVIGYPEHLGYYTASTLGKLMNDAGFNTNWIKTTGISLSRFQSSIQTEKKSNEDPIEEENTPMVQSGSLDEKLRIKMENNTVLNIAKRIANSSLSALRLGDNMKGLFTRLND